MLYRTDLDFNLRYACNNLSCIFYEKKNSKFKENFSQITLYFWSITEISLYASRHHYLFKLHHISTYGIYTNIFIPVFFNF